MRRHPHPDPPPQAGEGVRPVAGLDGSYPCDKSYSPQARSIPSPACGGGLGWGLSPRSRCQRGSRAQSPRERRDVERLEAVMRKPADVVLEQLSQISDAVFQHRDAVDAHAPGKALVDVGIDAAGAQHVRMHHAAAEDFEPVLAFAETNLALVAPALDVDLERGLGEREERRAKPHVDVVDLEERLAELVQDPFEMAEMRALVDDEALDLVELRRMRCIGIDAIGAARADDADRRLSALSIVRTCTGDVCVRNSMREPSSFGLKKNVSCISRAGWPSGKFSFVKL